MVKTTAKAVAYLRISRSDPDSYALETQERVIRMWCEANAIELVGIYSDDGISGSVAPWDREGATQAIEHARKAGVLVVSKLDRASRDVRQLLELVDDRLGKKASFVSVGENFDTSTPAGRAMLTMLVAFAEFERNRIAERCRDTAQTLRANGRRGAGAIPFGYRVEVGGRYKSANGMERDIQHLVEHPEEQKTLRRMVTLQSKGKSLQAIADDLNNRGQLRRENRPWTRQLVHRVMQSEQRRCKARADK